jgi:antitoxin (DNA-binding transcriptional repressor) of toxin-antitoxin stability system
MYNTVMKVISTTEARKHISDMLDAVAADGANFVIGRHDAPEVVLVKFPSAYRSDLSDITNVNSYSNSFDFLKNEPDIYSVHDVKKKYA